MNKNRYKLIFSQSKSCLVPVAECIKSAVGNGSSDSVSTSEGETDEPPLAAPHALSPVSLWVKNAFNPVSSVMQLTWKHVSILLLTVVSVPAFAAIDVETIDAERNATLDALAKIKTQELKKIENDENIQLAQTNSGTNNTEIKLSKTENNVLVIDITKPNDKGVSDNRFEKFITSNGAIFRNNNTQAKSEIVGYLEANPNLKDQKLADVILTQVTGSESSTIKGALEVLGKQADLVIANQNGITLNGAKAINAKHFVVTTSDLIDPKKLKLNVTKGTVTVDVNGFATDGLPYLDIIAKKIEQKQSILPEIEKNTKTQITLIAGQSKYDLKEHQLDEKNSGVRASEDEVAITGASTGAMHGKNIKLIVTDKGAGVKHDGIILSEDDIHIELHDGDLDLGNTTKKTLQVTKNLERRVQAQKNITVKGAKRTTIGSEVQTKKLEIQTKELKIEDGTEVRAKDEANITSEKSLDLQKNAKLIANKVEVKTEALTNSGVIYGSDVKLDADDLVNNKEIFAEEKLTIYTKGKDFTIQEQNYQPVRLLKETASLKPGFVNKGSIESKKEATLTFKDKTSFLVQDSKFIQAGEKLTINAHNVEIEGKEIQLSSNLTINAEDSFVNRRGTLTSAQNLTIKAKQGGIYNVGGILGAAKSLNLSTQSTEYQKGNIINQEDAFLHTLGEMTLNTHSAVYNIGEIYAGKKITVNAHELINDVRLSGDITYKTLGSSRLYEMSEVASHGWHTNVYKLNLDIQELDKANIKVEKRGAIRSDGNFDFKGSQLTQGLTSDDFYSKLINHGLINVKGTFNVQVDKVTNDMKYFERNALSTVFKNKASIKVHYQPLARFIWTALSGNTVREFDNLESFLDAVFSPSPLATTSLYSAENYSAYKILRHVQHSDMYHKAMVQVFGAEWHNQSYDTMKAKWKTFKENPTSFKYYPVEKAKILANKLDGSIANLQNGDYSEYGSFNGSLTVGKHDLTLPRVEFRPEIGYEENLESEGIDFTLIAELLETPNLFIDYSVQFEKKYLDEEATQPPKEENNVQPSVNDSIYKPKPRTSKEPDYQNPDEYIDNQDEYAGANYFFNKLGLDTQGNQKINVLGDNYFDHQLITRTIEKKADNRLNQKYNLTDVELVKKLMENSTSQAKALDLKIGAGL